MRSLLLTIVILAVETTGGVWAQTDTPGSGPVLEAIPPFRPAPRRQDRATFVFPWEQPVFVEPTATIKPPPPATATPSAVHMTATVTGATPAAALSPVGIPTEALPGLPVPSDDEEVLVLPLPIIDTLSSPAPDLLSATITPTSTIMPSSTTVPSVSLPMEASATEEVGGEPGPEIVAPEENPNLPEDFTALSSVRPGRAKSLYRLPNMDQLKINRTSPRPGEPTPHQLLAASTNRTRLTFGEGTPSPAPPPEVKRLLDLVLIPVLMPSHPTMRVKAGNVNLRLGPGTHYLNVMRNETPLRLSHLAVIRPLETEGDWVRLATTDGIEGWVRQDLLETVPNVSGLISSEAVNLRRGPGVETPSLGKLDLGGLVRCGSPTGVWYPVETNEGITGWVAKEFITPVTWEGWLRPRVFLLGSEYARLARLEAVPEESAGPGYRTWQLALLDEDFVKNGRIMLIALVSKSGPGMGADQLVSLAKSRENVLLFSADRVWADHAYGASRLAEMGCEDRLCRENLAVEVLAVRGQKTGNAWGVRFSTFNPVPGMVGVVYQSGPNRGGILPLDVNLAAPVVGAATASGR